MTLIAPGPFTSPGLKIFEQELRDSYEGVGQIILLAHTTNNTAQTFTAGASTGVSGGTVDHSLRLLPGDGLVFVMFDSAAGATASFTPGNSLARTTIEGDTAGVYQTTAWTPDSTKTDMPVVSFSGAPAWISVWSTRVDECRTIQAFPTQYGSVAVTGTYAGAGVRRMALYLIRPRFGYRFPIRGARVVATGSVATNSTSGGNTLDPVSVTWTGSGVRTTAEALLTVAMAASGSGNLFVDADGDDTAGNNSSDNTAFELQTQDFAVTGSCYAVSRGYTVDAARRPGALVNVKYTANPTTAGHATAVLVYALQPDSSHGAATISGTGAIATAGRIAAAPAAHDAGLVMAGKATVRGPIKFPGTRGGWLAMSSKAWIRSRYLPRADKNTGIALAGKALMRGGVKFLVASGGLSSDGLAVMLKPSTPVEPGTLLPPGNFISPAHLRYSIVPAWILGKSFVHGTATIVGSGTVAASAKLGKHGTATISGTGTINATGAKKLHGSATISGTGTVNATGHATLTGPGDINGAGALGVSGKRGQHGAATISGHGTIDAAWINGQQVHGQATILGHGTITAQSKAKWNAQATIGGAGTVFASRTTAHEADLSVQQQWTASVAVATQWSATVAVKQQWKADVALGGL